MREIELVTKRNINGILGFLPEGSRIEYLPWNHEWQGMSESERVAKGIFVLCFGHGEFLVFRPGDVDVIERSES